MIEPPYQGGRVEIFTKPGRDSLHGALFFTDSESGLNATDPFAVSATPAGKRRYGFEFGGPIRKQKSDFFIALERRDIQEFNVVNAVVLECRGRGNAAERKCLGASAFMDRQRAHRLATEPEEHAGGHVLRQHKQLR